jgi:hypothetical protein
MKNIVQPGRPHIKISHMYLTRCITKATNTLSEYVLLIDCPRQQWLY